MGKIPVRKPDSGMLKYTIRLAFLPRNILSSQRNSNRRERSNLLQPVTKLRATSSPDGICFFERFEKAQSSEGERDSPEFMSPRWKLMPQLERWAGVCRSHSLDGLRANLHDPGAASFHPNPTLILATSWLTENALSFPVAVANETLPMSNNPR